MDVHDEVEIAADSARLVHGDVRLILNSVIPIVRLSVKVCDCYYQDFVFSSLVNDSVRETPGLTSSRSLRARLPCFGEFSNSIEGLQHFSQKRLSESGGFMAVIFDSLIQFDLQELQKVQKPT